MAFPREWRSYKSGELKSHEDTINNNMWWYCIYGLKGDEIGLRSQIKELEPIASNQRIQDETKRADEWLKESLPVYLDAILRSDDTSQQIERIKDLGGPLALTIKKFRDDISEATRDDGQQGIPRSWESHCPRDRQVDLGNIMYWYCQYGMESNEDGQKSQIAKLRKRHYEPKFVSAIRTRADQWIKKQIGKRQAEAHRKKQDRNIAKDNHIVQIDNTVVRRTQATIPNISGSPRKLEYLGHPNDIVCLEPAGEWDLYIDESGRTSEFVANGKGVVAGVLSCVDDKLPKQKPLHAGTDSTEKQFTAEDKIIETLINHKQTGVLAVPALAYEGLQEWSSLIGSLIDLVLRLLPLPIDGSMVKLNIYVEKRFSYACDNDFKSLEEACRFSLRSALPKRATTIEFSIKMMDKSHPYDPYPDIVANTCYAGIHENATLPRKRLAMSGWDGTCYLRMKRYQNTAQELRKCLDYFSQGYDLPETDWDKLLNAEAPSDAYPSLISGILAGIGLEAKCDGKLWEKYLHHVNAHLNSKAINLATLKRQLQWLDKYKPDSAEMLKRLELLWLTVNLADRNHHGEAISEPEAATFREKANALLKEDAPLVCHAYLHLAVSYTNAFAFSQARQTMADLWSLCPGGDCPGPDAWLTAEEKYPYLPAVFGLQAFGQVLSTCGQHAAFDGKLAAAAQFFHQARAAFDRLSDQGAGALDKAQTTAYLVNVLADDEKADSQAFADACKEYFGDDLVKVAKELAVNDNEQFMACKKYHHHILLRLFAYGRLGAEAKDAYVRQAPAWVESADGHPWEMIEFYRAMLLPAGEQRLEHLQKALAIVNDDGDDAVLKVIAAVIAAAIMDEDPKATVGDQPVREFYQNTVKACVEKLPALQASGRAEVLTSQMEHPLPPLKLAQKALPFNFH